MGSGVRRHFRGHFRAAAAGAAVLVAALGAPQLATHATASTAKTSTAKTSTSTATPAKPNGTDASCPAASPSAAGSTSVGAPTRARAIAGSGSATVVWCPPRSGASHVTSYTVTAQPGNASVTATVPNDWAIIDGLHDGTSYTFTVTASTSTGTGTKTDTTAPVTPAAIPGPKNVITQAPETVSYDGSSMIIGGKRIYLTAVEFDPWRTPSPGLWLDDLQKVKAEGYDAVTVYFDWDYNSPSPGAYDFSGVRDYNEFLNLAQEAGLYVIARPGPYINAETDGGGIPGWVLPVPNGYRSDVEPYLSAARQWLSEIDPVIAAHQVTRGGNVLAYQVENEYGGQGASADDYMAALEQQAKDDGINVPFTFNQCCGSQTYTSGTGKVDISGTDNYPLGFNCADPGHFGNPQSGYPVYAEEPVYLPEYQGGSFDGWGGAGYDNCYNMTGPDFENVFYKDNIAQGSTMQSYYMGVGGTNWGWLPAPQVYSSYDYGSAIRETGELGTTQDPNDIDGSKYGENKLINDFETSVAPLTQTQAATAPKADNPAVTTIERDNTGTRTGFVYVRQSNASSTADATTHLENVSADGQTFAQVPQSGTITLKGRDSKLLLTGYHFGTAPSSGTTGSQDLVYSTSELMTQETIGGTGTALLYGPRGTGGETVLHYASQPTVKTVSGSVTSTWDSSQNDLRLDYTHDGLAEVEISGGGAPPLRLLLADTSTAENFWPETTAAGPVLVEGGYLVRTATVSNGVLKLTGDTSRAGKISVWGGTKIRSVEWNSRPLATSAGPDGELTGSVAGPAPVSLPALANWKFASETPEAQPGFDDSGWTLADHPGKLDATDYGYDHGFTWYRGHFAGNHSNGSATGVTLTADGIAPTGAYSVWLNGAFLGSGSAAGAQTRTFTFPAGSVKTGGNVIAVLVENTGNPEGPTGEKTGLTSASLTGSTAGVTWRLAGSPDGTSDQDPTRGIMNGSGLYGSDNGWNLPGYPDGSWQNVALPDRWSDRGVPPGIGWYRTSFSLNLPAQSYVPVDVQVGASGPGAGGTANYRAFIYVNGWLVGRYVNTVGPQHQFYVPAGILNDHGANTIAIASWGLDSSGGGLDSVSLVAAGNQAGGTPVPPVSSPGYSGSGSPSPPTLATSPAATRP